MITYNAIGAPLAGLVAKTANDLLVWTFFGSDQNVTARLKYATGVFGEPVQITHPLGIEVIPLPQGTIQLPEAITILNNNGYTSGFVSAGMGTPAELGAQPMFWFCVNGMTQGVSASTGQFSRDLLPCGPITDSDD